MRLFAFLFFLCLGQIALADLNQWSAGPWSQCLLPCGAETKSRTVQCLSPAGTIVADAECTTPKPDTTSSCDAAACQEVTFVWAKVQGPCSATECGAAGIAQNSLQCLLQDGSPVAADYCLLYSSDAKPPASEECVRVCRDVKDDEDDEDGEDGDDDGDDGDDGVVNDGGAGGAGTGGAGTGGAATGANGGGAVTADEDRGEGATGASSSPRSIGIAVGAGLGGLVALAAIGGALAFYVYKKRQQDQMQQGQQQDEESREDRMSSPPTPNFSFPTYSQDMPPPKPSRY